MYLRENDRRLSYDVDKKLFTAEASSLGCSTGEVPARHRIGDTNFMYNGTELNGENEVVGWRYTASDGRVLFVWND